ncbi:MAG: CHRD domain-containing protein [Novosphingobium sp.]
MNRALRPTALLAATAALGLLAGPALAATVVLTANLTGEAVPDGAGVAGGTATFRAEADPALGDFCYVLAFKGLGTVRDAAIVAADAPGDGKAVIALEVAGVETDLCVAVEPDVLKAVAADPGKYHVVVRSVANPKGAARGVLGK